MLEVVAITILMLLIYNHFIYPGAVILLAMSRRSKATVKPEKVQPKVSLLIAAYNEEKVIKAKLDNSIALEYPNLVEIIVISDGSTDSTPDIVSAYPDDRVVSLHVDARSGKSAALNRGVEIAKGEIVVFSDANNDFSANAISELVKHFVNPKVGGVTGAKKIKIEQGRQASAGDNLYWRYESAIKLAESKILSITCSDGEIFAMRRDLYQDLKPGVINDDLQLTLDLVYGGFKVLYEPEATSHESASISIIDDFWVKVRMVAGGFQAISWHWAKIFNVFLPFNIMFISHKVIRWLVPELLIALFFLSTVLLDNPVFQILFVLQLLFYGTALVGWATIGRYELPMIVYVPFYFCAMNLAALLGFFRFLSNSQTVNWRKAVR